MIVPMKKVALLVLDSQQHKALNVLRKLGVMHVEKRSTTNDELTELKQIETQLNLAESVLEDYIKKIKKKDTPTLLNEDDSKELLKKILTLHTEKNQIMSEANRLKSLFERYAPWGEFDPADLEECAKNGVYLFPATVEEKKYSKLPDEIKTIKVKTYKKLVYCLVYSDSPELPVELDRVINELPLPEKSIKALKDDYVNLFKRSQKIEKELLSLAPSLNSLKNYHKEIETRIEFEDVRSSMPSINLNESLEKKVSISWLSGFIPVEDLNTLEQTAKDEDWGYIIQEPEESDDVPTKLKGNRFVSLIHPLFDFLDSSPGYFEVDISLSFLLFFGVFVAMIFGDAAYGILFLSAILFKIIQAKIKKQKVENGLWLFVYLSIMSIIWGVITCSWFGLPIEQIPDALKGLAIKGFSGMVPVDEKNKNIMMFSFCLGFAQLVLAHLIAIRHNLKSPKSLGDVGSILMLIGMFFLILHLIIDPVKYPMYDFILLSIGVGFALNFIFSNYERSIGQSVLDSLKNVITMVLGVVNVFADIMSYIRLWAVGLAGGAISMTINSIAGPMLGRGFVFVVAVILLVGGHGLNIAMNMLSVLVHAVRLNTMEFSNHLGLTWSGIKYQPFSETVKK